MVARKGNLDEEQETSMSAERSRDRTPKHDEAVGKKAASDFAKAFSCSYSVTMNLARVLGMDRDDPLLHSVVGFGSGVSTMGDTCGAVNGGVIVLGQKYSEFPLSRLCLLCSEYCRRLEQRLGMTTCGELHGGKHLASNFRRAILTGKSLKCMKVVRNSAEVLLEIDREVQANEGSFLEEHDHAGGEILAQHFEQQGFHCCQSTIQEIARKSQVRVDHLSNASRGFCGGIGLNGTLCGAIAGGVLCLGSAAGVDLSKSQHKDTLRLVFHGLLKSEAVFRDEKRFPAAKVYGQCQEVYRTVEQNHGGAHCRDIIGLRLDAMDGVQQYIASNKVRTCEAVVQTVADTVTALLSPS